MPFSASFIFTICLTYSYFTIQLFFTQIIYSKNKVLLFTFLSLAVPVLLYAIFPAHRFDFAIKSLGICYYFLALSIIKFSYKNLNSFLIENGKINSAFAAKDFTYVLHSKGIFDKGHYWNESLAGKPSWLDHTLSVTLILLPILLAIISLQFEQSIG